ncbi:hypothetical protein N4Q63_26760, partial [Leclercia adecarboxylata]|nr:hypothetical protein [Leclercia adecarboxylata]
VQEFSRGKPAIGTGDKQIPVTVCSFQAIVPKNIDWRDFDAKPVYGAGSGPQLESNYETTA